MQHLQLLERDRAIAVGVCETVVSREREREREGEGEKRERGREGGGERGRGRGREEREDRTPKAAMVSRSE